MHFMQYTSLFATVFTCTSIGAPTKKTPIKIKSNKNTAYRVKVFKY
jgi:hypothetical protein